MFPKYIAICFLHCCVYIYSVDVWILYYYFYYMYYFLCIWHVLHLHMYSSATVHTVHTISFHFHHLSCLIFSYMSKKCLQITVIYSHWGWTEIVSQVHNCLQRLAKHEMVWAIKWIQTFGIWTIRSYSLLLPWSFLAWMIACDWCLSVFVPGAWRRALVQSSFPPYVLVCPRNSTSPNTTFFSLSESTVRHPRLHSLPISIKIIVVLYCFSFLILFPSSTKVPTPTATAAGAGAKDIPETTRYLLIQTHRLSKHDQLVTSQQNTLLLFNKFASS